MIRVQQALVDVVGEAGVELGAVTADQMNASTASPTASAGTPSARPEIRATAVVGQVGERDQGRGGVGQRARVGRIVDDRREGAVEVAT